MSEIDSKERGFGTESFFDQVIAPKMADNGGPAFPAIRLAVWDEFVKHSIDSATLLLVSECADGRGEPVKTGDVVVLACKIADELLAERKKRFG